MRVSIALQTVLLICLFAAAAVGQQMADPQFDARVENPAYLKNFPRVLFDEAHNNLDNTHGRYKPFVDLLFNDGYHLTVNRQPFTKALLGPVKILVIVNPLGGEDVDDDGADAPAFTSAECEAVSEWVKNGGALLFIVDSGPFASAAEILATGLGVGHAWGRAPRALPARAARYWPATPRRTWRGQAGCSVVLVKYTGEILALAVSGSQANPAGNR